MPAILPADRLTVGMQLPIQSQSTAYAERWRPQFHYSPPEGRLADPNGLDSARPRIALHDWC